MKTLQYLAVALVLLAVGCAPPYRQTFWDAGNDKGWTEKQKLAAFAYADKVFWAHDVGEGKYVVLYGKVPTTKVESQLETVLHDLDEVLDPHDSNMRQYLDTFNLRADMEHDERITEVIYSRVHASRLYDDFQGYLGEIPQYGDEAIARKGYNLKKIFLAKDLSKTFPFTSSEVEGAKKNGKLKLIESADYSFDQKYAYKDSDPNHPNDKNEFVWKPKKASLHLENFKIIDQDKPEDNKGNYIEGYRTIAGKKESQPAIKIFFPSSMTSAVVLIDKNVEGVDPGFGIPNVLELLSVNDLSSVLKNDHILADLFNEHKKAKRTVPETKLFQIEISKIGGEGSVWEKSSDANGWVVPFKYQDNKNENYNVRIKYSIPNIDPTGEKTVSEFRNIEWVEKEYTTSGSRYKPSVGEVIEYYKAKEPFSSNIKAEVLEYEDTKKISFVFPDGSEIQGFVSSGNNKFIENEPFAKSYKEGGRRWWIEKSKDSQVFDKRRVVSSPRESIGEYKDRYMELTPTMSGPPSDMRTSQPRGNQLTGEQATTNSKLCIVNGQIVIWDNASSLPTNCTP